MRLIDAEELKCAVRKKFSGLPDRCEINELINAAPIVEIVHCSDCQYWYAEIGASTGWLPCQEIVTQRD
jgi:hypothetical protein